MRAISKVRKYAKTQLYRVFDKPIDSRESILRLLPPNSACVEIGVFKGAFSRTILDTAKPRLLHLVDPWKKSARPEHKDSMYALDSAADMDQIHQNVLKRFSQEIDRNKVLVHRRTSIEFLEGIDPEALDFIYIDGDHNYDAVVKDLHLSWRVLKLGGIVALDDYARGAWWRDGVVQAGNEFIGSHPVEILMAGGRQLAFRKIEWAKRAPGA